MTLLYPCPQCTASGYISLGARVRELELQYKGIRAAARALSCDAAYLLRLRNGDKCNPGSDMLRKLGIKRVVTYVRV